MEKFKNNINPWKGLNSYKEGEVIYGRSHEIESLSQYIINNTQTVLYGKSGIGKSSILNAGIFPIVRQYGLNPVGIRLDHNTSIPYIRQIKDAVINSGIDVHEILPAILENDETLWEYLHRNIFFNKDGNRIQLLLVFDQFEEIFTLQKNENKKRAFFDELADLLNDVTPLYIVNANNSQNLTKDSKVKEVEGRLDDLDIDIDIEKAATDKASKYLKKIDYHVVFTLREDFLSFLERYTKFIPVMKSNRYALLPLNEEQAAEIITKPKPGLVSVDVAKLIIEKVTKRTDFTLGDAPEIEVDAAILSLYLSRLYVRKGNKKETITAELVYKSSKDIIKDFYEFSIFDLPETDIKILEDKLITYEGRRNNVSRNDLIRKGVLETTIHTLVEEKKLLRQFSYQDDIRVELIHDILCPIVNERREHREQIEKEKEAKRIEEENRQIRMQNDRLNKIRSLFLSEKSIGCQYNRYLAQMLALEALPTDLEHPDKPFVSKAEVALRNTFRIPYCPMIGHKGVVTYVMFTSDLKHVISLSRDGMVSMWDVSSGTLVKEFACEEHTHSALFAGDNEGEMLVFYSKGTVNLYSFKNLELIETYPLEGTLPSALAVSPDGTTIAIGQEGGSVMLHDKKIGDWRIIDCGMLSTITCICYSRNGKYLFCGTEDGKIVLLEIDGDEIKKKDSVECEGTGSNINAISISCDGKKIAYSVGGRLTIVENETKFVGKRQEAKVKTTECQSKKHILFDDELESKITCISWSPDDRYLLWGNADGLVSMYDTCSGPYSRRLVKAASYMKAMDYTPNGEELMCLSYHNTLRRIEIKSGKEEKKYGYKNQIGKEAQSADGIYRAVYNKDRQMVELYEDNTPGVKNAFALEGEMTSLSISPDSSLLAIATKNGNVSCWNIVDGNRKFNLKGCKSTYNAVLFSPDGVNIATIASQGVYIWNKDSGELKYTIPTEKGRVFSLAFSPKGERLAIGSESGMISIWNVEKEELVDSLETKRDGDPVMCMSFSPNGEQLSASYRDGTLMAWACPSLKTLMEDVRLNLRSRRFTDDERKKYYLD